MRKILRLCLLLCAVAVLAACAPFYRGFEGSSVVSPARPDVTVGVKAMPMLSHGRISPFLNTDQGYQFPEAFVSVYGTDAASPMAIVTLAIVPNNAWEWDPLTFSGPLAQETLGATFGEQAFYGNVRIVNGAEDAFSPLFADKEQWASLRWLAQRFAILEDFSRAKIILEYREPLPESLAAVVGQLPVYSDEVQAFRERAIKAFEVRFGGAVSPDAAAPYIKTLNERYMGKFLGSMSLKNDVFPLYND